MQIENYTYHYHAFGLSVASQIEIPEFVSSENSIDEQVIIKINNVPEKLDHAQFSGVRFEGLPGKFLLKVDNVARYLVSNGTTIEIQAYENSKEKDIRLFLLGSAIGALLHQRGLLPMHGSAVQIKEKAFLFSGISGVGKSTLAASFAKQGFPVLTDDVCVVSTNDNGKPLIYPGYPQMKLWADSIARLGAEAEKLNAVRDGIQKYGVSFNNSYTGEPLELAGIYIISTKNTDGFTLKEIKGIEKFNILKNNTYRLNFIKGTGTTPTHFKHLNNIAQHCFAKTLERPSKGFHLAELTDLITTDINSYYGNLDR